MKQQSIRHSVFAAKLQSLAELSERELAAISLVLPSGPHRRYAARSEMRISTYPSGRGIVLDGLAYRYKELADGGRQILSLILPGDFVEPIRSMPSSDFLVCARIATTVRLIEVDDRAFHDLTTLPGIAQALARSAKQEENMLYHRLLTLGRRHGVQRLAAFFCEMAARLAANGQSDGERFALPLTQEEIGDTLGMSTVHVNRTFQQLRRRKLVDVHRNQFELKNRMKLAASANWDPAYLLFRESTSRAPQSSSFVESALQD